MFSNEYKYVYACSICRNSYGTDSNSHNAVPQVMGSLADKKCIQGQRVSGILVKRNFNYHILSPSDLSSQYL